MCLVESMTGRLLSERSLTLALSEMDRDSAWLSIAQVQESVSLSLYIYIYILMATASAADPLQGGPRHCGQWGQEPWVQWGGGVRGGWGWGLEVWKGWGVWGWGLGVGVEPRGQEQGAHDKHGRRGRVRAGWGWGLGVGVAGAKKRTSIGSHAAQGMKNGTRSHGAGGGCVGGGGRGGEATCLGRGP